MPSLLIVDDDRSIIRIFQRCFEHTGVTVIAAASAAEAVKITGELQPDVVILDIVLPDQSGLSAFQEIRRLNSTVPVIFVTAAGTSDTAIESMRLGAMDYLSKPLDMAKIRAVVGQAMGISDIIRSTQAEDQSVSSEATGPGRTSSDALIGHSPAMQEVYKAIGRVTGQNINVLIRGESGTGKELVARAIHQHSPRADKKFLAVNCAAIPEALLESELFGHEKGAFTGAVSQRIGKFEECDGGTLFLDEVGDMPLLMQSKVLRAIQDKEFHRVGGNHLVKADVWLVAATHRDLEAMVAAGEFRADLCYRLNGYTILLPPLRDRHDDIPLLVEYYMRRFNSEIGRTITGVASETMELLKQYPWPGNIRELQTVLKHAMLHAVGPVLLPEFLPPELRDSSPRGPRLAPPVAVIPSRPPAMTSSPQRGTPLPDTAFQAFIENHLRSGTQSLYADSLKYMECTLLSEVLRHTSGNQSQAALLLGITRGCLRSKLRLHGIMISSSIAIQAPAGEPEQCSVGSRSSNAPEPQMSL